ncbi:hypothetical protein HDU98_001537 [Podochytrium sp. JEL0797]|nr:hypothetical protein HDU98_001537 [Podochytrium sp. JEL0797]
MHFAAKPLVFTDSAQECVSITGTSSCAPWASGLFINTTALAQFYGAALDAQQWDALVASQTTAATSLGCAKDAQVQFMATYQCLRDVMVFSGGCNDLMGATVPPAPLCADTCDQFSASLSAMIANPQSCPAVADGSPEAVTRAKALTAGDHCKATVAAWANTTAASTCVESVQMDFDSCGFANSPSAFAAYCSSLKNSPACCSTAPPSLSKAMLVANETGNATDAPATADQDSLSAGAIVGIAIGVVLLLALLSACCIVIANRQKMFPKNHIINRTLGDPRNVRGMPSFSPTKRAPLSQFNNMESGPESIALTGAASKTSLTTVTSTTTTTKDYVRIPEPSLGKKTVIVEYTASQPDELSLKVGDVVDVGEAFDDGWGSGTIVGKGIRGMFPLQAVGMKPPV